MPAQTAFHRIVITGASNGIGTALALAYARNGVSLGLIGRDPARLSEVANRCRERGAEVETGLIDVTDGPALGEWLMAFDQTHPVDLVIANAGIASTLASPEANEDWETVRRVFDVNTWGTLNTITPLMQRMRARRRGQIGIVSSLSAYAGMPISPAYCGSKAAIKVYGESLRGWLAPQGVGVTVICPGFVKSDMSDRFPGPTPFKVSAERAASLIQDGLARNRARIAFPFPLTLSMWFLSILPPSMSLWLQRRFGFA
jgi:short-subunit dehydrogenase